MDRTPLVAGFGLIVVDILMSADDVELYRKNSVDGQTIQIGGVIPTALVVLSRLGISTQFHSTVGDDLFGTELRSILSQERVDVRGVVTVAHQTPFASVIVHPTSGKRTSFYTTGNFSTDPSDIFSLSLDPNSTHLLIDGHNSLVALELIQKAKRQDTDVLLDLGNPKNGIDTLIPLSDTIIVPQAYWKPMWGDRDPREIVSELLTKGPKLVVLTMEEKGCLVGQNGSVFHQPSYAVNAIDTNGAGDVFFGSFVYGLTQHWDLQKSAQFSCAAAARSCTLIGKNNKIPRSVGEVFSFMETHAVKK